MSAREDITRFKQEAGMLRFKLEELTVNVNSQQLTDSEKLAQRERVYRQNEESWSQQFNEKIQDINDLEFRMKNQSV